MNWIERVGCVVLAAVLCACAWGQEKPEVPPAVDKGLVAAYDFNGAADGVVRDITGNGVDAKVTGASVFADSPEGKALVLDGNVILTTAAAPGLQSLEAVTVDVWLQVDDVASDYRVVATRGGSAWRMMIAAKNGVYFGMKGEGKRMDLGAGKVETGKWTRITAVFAKPNVGVYVDGKRVAEHKHDFAMNAGGGLVIGGYAPGKNGFIGKLDQLRVYNIARPPQAGDEKPLPAK